MITDQIAFRRALRLAIESAPKMAGQYLEELSRISSNPQDEAAVTFVRDHLTQYGKFPHADTVAKKCGVALPPSQENLTYEMSLARESHVEHCLRNAVDEAAQMLNEQKKPSAALSSLTHALFAVTQGHVSSKISDFRDVADGTLLSYKETLAGNVKPQPSTGYPSLDARGRFSPGNILSIVGRTGSGKTYLMLRIALYQWLNYGIRTLFVTQEMSAEEVEQRCLTMVAQVNPDPITKGVQHQYELGGLTHAQYLEALEDAAAALKNNENPFLIYDTTMAGTVQDVSSVAAMHGVSNVWIDGAYLLKHPDRRLNRYARVGENVDLLKEWCQKAHIRLGTSWQFKRNTGKGGAGEDIDEDDIGYSHAISETSSTVLGLLRPPKSVSQLKQRTVSVIKGRNGESGSFDIHFDFSNMNFDEIGTAELDSELAYL